MPRKLCKGSKDKKWKGSKEKKFGEKYRDTKPWEATLMWLGKHKLNPVYTKYQTQFSQSISTCDWPNKNP